MVAYFIDHDIISIKSNRKIKKKKKKKKNTKSIILSGLLKCWNDIYNIGISIIGRQLNSLFIIQTFYRFLQTAYFYLHSFTFFSTYREYRD